MRNLGFQDFGVLWFRFYDFSLPICVERCEFVNLPGTSARAMCAHVCVCVCDHVCVCVCDDDALLEGCTS